MKTKTYADGSTVTATYDNHGNLATLTDASGVITFTFDAGNRLKHVGYPGGRTLDYDYDTAGRRRLMVDQDGFTVKYEYDGIGRLEYLKDAADNVIVRYRYDDVGRIFRKEQGDGSYTTYQYDSAGQLLLLVNRAPNGTVHSQFAYTYDALGRRKTMTTLDGAWTYEYDATGQLTHAVLVSTNPAIANQDMRYEYDAVANRIRTIINGVTTDYVTNIMNQYVRVGNNDYAYFDNVTLTIPIKQVSVYGVSLSFPPVVPPGPRWAGSGTRRSASNSLAFLLLLTTARSGRTRPVLQMPRHHTPRLFGRELPQRHYRQQQHPDVRYR